MVRVAGLTGQTEAGVSRRLPDGRTPQQTLDDARERVVELYGSQAKLWSDELCPALAAERIVVSSVDELEPAELAELDDRFEREIFPVLTPLAVGPGQPFPYISALSISLGLFVADPETGEERFARVKVPEGLPRFFPARAERPLRAAGASPLPLPARALPRDGDPRAVALPRHARRRSRGGRRGRRPARGRRAPAPPRAVRRGDAARGVGVDVAGDAGAAPAGAARPRRARLSARRDARPGRPRPALPARPARPQERSVGAGGAAAVELVRVRRRAVRRDPRGRPPRPPPLRLVRGELRVVRRPGGGRSRGDRDQVDGVPDERRHAARAGADRRVGARQADRLPRRDQGARRRAPQHRVVALARAGGRPHRLRLPGPQDPREDDARRAARGGRAAPLRPSGHRQLQRRHRPQLRGLRALHRRRGHRRRRRRPLQPPDRIRPARRSSASCSSRRSRSASG